MDLGGDRDWPMPWTLGVRVGRSGVLSLRLPKLGLYSNPPTACELNLPLTLAPGQGGGARGPLNTQLLQGSGLFNQ